MRQNIRCNSFKEPPHSVKTNTAMTTQVHLKHPLNEVESDPKKKAAVFETRSGISRQEMHNSYQYIAKSLVE